MAELHASESRNTVFIAELTDMRIGVDQSIEQIGLTLPFHELLLPW